MKPLTTGLKIGICLAAAVVVLLLGVALGSVSVSLRDILSVLGFKLFGRPTAASASVIAIVWQLRLPRVLLGFFVGAALAVSGAVMQSVLKNPLASSYTLGVSSGASLGVGVLMILGVSAPALGLFLYPAVALPCGLATVFLAVAFTSRLDKRLDNNTIILVGMVFSLFINAILTTLAALSRDQLARIVYWQMGSFAKANGGYVLVLAPLAVLGLLFCLRYAREMDILTFGEEQAVAMGVNAPRVKTLLLGAAAVLTGAAVAFSGVIGFVDLVAPHVVRRLFGASHRRLLPLSALLGGTFMVLADLVARTVVAPIEMPVGAITALVGAPFFAFVYFRRRKNLLRTP